MTAVVQFSPACSVKLIKVIRRSSIAPGIPVAARYGNILEYDLTPYLGEKGGIRTSKSVKEPAGGFSLTLADKPSADWADSIYALIEPMDVVEIRFARNPSDLSSIVVAAPVDTRADRLAALEARKAQLSAGFDAEDVKANPYRATVDSEMALMSAASNPTDHEAHRKMALAAAEQVKAIIDAAFEKYYGAEYQQLKAQIAAIKNESPPSAKRAAGSLPMVMRGFVSTVKRSEGMAQGPERHITVMGQDYGKIWQILQVLYLNNAVVGEYFLTGMNFFQKYGIDASNNMEASEFLDKVVNGILLPYMNKMTVCQYTLWTAALQAEVTTPGVVVGSVVNSWPGGQGIYHLLARCLDVGTFNEMFIEDREDSSVVVLRPIPWHDVNKKPIQDGTPEIRSVDIDASHIKSIEVERTDQAVANMFWVRLPHYDLINDEAFRLASQLKPITDYPNCDPNFYGIRQMDQSVYMGPPKWIAGQGDTAKKQSLMSPSAIAWRKAKLDTLVAASRDSVVFEHGSMRLRGNEKIGAGTFLNITRGGLTSRCYVTSVSHEYLPFRGFWTTVQFERGTGFIDRAGAHSPYIAEMASVRP